MESKCIIDVTKRLEELNQGLQQKTKSLALYYRRYHYLFNEVFFRSVFHCDTYLEFSDAINDEDLLRFHTIYLSDMSFIIIEKDQSKVVLAILSAFDKASVDPVLSKRAFRTTWKNSEALRYYTSIAQPQSNEEVIML